MLIWTVILSSNPRPLPTTHRRPPTSYHPLSTTQCPQVTSHHSPPNTYLPPPTSYHLSSTSHLTLPTSHLPPPTSHRPPPTAHLSVVAAHLPQVTSHQSPTTAHCPPPTSHSHLLQPPPTFHLPLCSARADPAQKSVRRTCKKHVVSVHVSEATCMRTACFLHVLRTLFACFPRDFVDQWTDPPQPSSY